MYRQDKHLTVYLWVGHYIRAVNAISHQHMVNRSVFVTDEQRIVYEVGNAPLHT